MVGRNPPNGDSMAKAATTTRKTATPAKKAGTARSVGKTKAKSAAARQPVLRAAAGKSPGKKAVATGSGVKKLVKSVAKKPVKKPVKKMAAKISKKTEKQMTRYKCKICGYIYSPFRGEPHNGIPAGTAFDDLPDDYVCPICGMEGKGRIGKWGFDEWRPTRYICSVCNYVYDEKRGEPHHGIKPGTKFDDLPDTYRCPVCALDPKINVRFGKVLKQGFQPLDI